MAHHRILKKVHTCGVTTFGTGEDGVVGVGAVIVGRQNRISPAQKPTYVMGGVRLL